MPKSVFTIRERENPSPEYPYEVYNGPHHYSNVVGSVEKGRELVSVLFPHSGVRVKRGPTLDYDETIFVARKYYGHGGDGIVECWDKEVFHEMTKDCPMTMGRLLEIIEMYHQDNLESMAFRD
jgi:hypothetical protein